MISQKQDGEDLVFVATDRSFGGAAVEALRLNGVTGEVSVLQVPVTSGTILGDLAVSGDAGFNGATPVGKATAYTQTYSTAARVVPVATSHTITDSSGGSASTSALAAVTQAGNAGSADLAPVQNNFATLAAELVLVKADLVAAKKVINSLIDDLQALGLVG